MAYEYTFADSRRVHTSSIRKRFGTRVRTLRQAAGLSQEAFADRCGFVRSYMSRIERGGANPSLDAIEVLADALGVKIATLFAEEGGGHATDKSQSGGCV